MGQHPQSASEPLALAMGIGPLFVVLPAGAGAREAVLVASLTTVLPVPDAVAAALVSRAVLVARRLRTGGAFLRRREEHQGRPLSTTD